MFNQKENESFASTDNFKKMADGNGDILMKALLNENEVTLPLTPVTGPYYRWTDFRDYYTKKLATFKEEDL